jgi:hypothetical protein
LTTDNPNTAARRFGLPNIILVIGLSILLCGEAWCGYRVQSLSGQQVQIKEDYSTVKNITFGLFSVDEWRDKVAAVVNGQVRDFKMTPEQKRQLQTEIEEQLHGMVNKVVKTMNKPQTSIAGKLKKLAFNTMVNTDTIQALVPSFARTIINKVNSPASRTRLKDIATGKLNQLERETYDSTATPSATVTNYMYRKYHVSDAGDFEKQINTRLASIRQITYSYSWAMLGCVIVALGLWLVMRKQTRLQTTLFVMSLLFALILLAVGVSASIIEVDARLKTLNFMLMGEKVAFENQVLFFQSKSIFGISEVLIKQPKPDAVLVGVLILVFVIIFPVMRLIAKGIHITSSKTFAQNKVLRYLAFDSAKWDMADVMVVGVLMTYIGLNGILKSQLSNLNIHNNFLTTITENDTSLQPGYFIFAGYVIFTLILSRILRRITPDEAGK